MGRHLSLNIMTNWLITTVLCAASAAPAFAQQVLVLPLDRFPVALSPGGNHVAGPGLSTGAALWSPGSGWTELGGPGGPGIAVARDGESVLANGGGTSALWIDGTGWVPLGFVGSQRGMALSSDGRYVAAQANQGGGTPYLWDRQLGAVTRLELPVGAAGAEVFGVSLGAVLSVGTASFAGGFIQAVAWDAAGHVTDIAPLGSEASAVSENGEWAVGSTPSAAGAVPYRWNRSSGRVDLPALGAGAAGYRSLKVSDDGALVIGNRVAAGSSPTGFAWSPFGGTLSLGDFLQFEGFGGVGDFTTVIDAAADGRRFVLSDVAAPGAARFVNVDPQVSSSFCSAGAANSTGAQGEAFLLGSNSPERNAIFLRAIALPPGVTVVPLVSPVAGSTPMAGGSPGTLCLGGGIGRFAPGGTDAVGAFQQRVDLGGIPTPLGPVAGASGQTWRFQCWYRDPSAGGSNFTDGVRVLLD